MGSSKKNQTCAPRPERDRSRAAGRFRRRAASRKATASSRQPALSEIEGKKETRLVLQKRVDTGDKRLPLGVVATQVPADHIVGHREESTIRTLSALDPRLL